ncbi:MAG TPA: peptidoglycan-associated lipoprotein Pal [Gemmatimonadaceae bacterium]|nr:peptidoglycan-associated lipoprotein Pal [Gemmatimonadaceae bacterium]
MMRTHRIAGLTLALLSVTILDACHHKAAPAPTPTQASMSGPNADSARLAQEDAARRAAADAARRRADSIAAAEAAARDAANSAGSLRSALTAMVHFDYDQSDLRPEDRAILDAKVPILQANPGVMIRIAGHTDERGSDEYNLALGQRRAAAAKRYLIDHGVADSRIETISYGEERPIAQGSDESAWAQNRRAEFEITSGGQTLRKP